MIGARGFLAVLAIALGSCSGWSAGMELPEDYRSVGVEIFRNDSYLFDVERALHREMARTVTSLVDARLEDPARADLVVRGTIESYTRRGGVRSRDNRLLETGLVVRVRAELWDRAADKIVSGPIPAVVTIGYTLDAPDTEEAAQRRALTILAEKIVLDLFTVTLQHPETE